MSEQFAFLLADISSFWGIIPSLLAFFSWKKGSSTVRLLCILIWGGTFISLAAFYMGFVLGMPNLFLLHIYTVFELILLTLIFRRFLNNILAKTILIIFPLFAAFRSIFIEQFNTMNVVNRSLSALLIMFYALSFFLYNLRELKIAKIEKEPLFWVSIGALFYNAASFFIFVFSFDLEPFEEMWFTYFGIHSVFTILLYSFYSLALWVQLKQRPASLTN